MHARIKLFSSLLFCISLLILSTQAAHAATPLIVGQQPFIQGMYFPNELRLPDPTQEGQIAYGHIWSPYAVDSYFFIPQHDATIPIEVLVPVRPSNKYFKPAWEIIGPNIPPQPMQIEFSIPPNSNDIGHDYLVPNSPRKTVYDPVSMEMLYHGNPQFIYVLKGQMYYINVYDPVHYMGDYVLKIGTIQTMNISPKQRFFITANLTGFKDIPSIDMLGIFLVLAGFIIGLGAVTIIDLHGFLARTSPYWTQATIRTHKVTKPLIWIGISLATIGYSILYRESGISNIAWIQLFLFIILILNGCFLSFWVSPRLVQREKEKRDQELLPISWQKAITVSFLISFFGWWSEVLLFVWYVLMIR